MSVIPFHGTLIILSGPGVDTAINLSQDELIIGRTEPAGLVINHPEVSRRHARVTQREGRYFLEDLGSVNGTQVNGQSVSGEYKFQ